jgi:hypothetical protein
LTEVAKLSLAVLRKQCARDLYNHPMRDGRIVISRRAERRAGELLLELEKNKGARGQGPGRGKKAVTPRDRLFDDAPKLSDLGVSKTQSSRWLKLALIPEQWSSFCRIWL